MVSILCTWGRTRCRFVAENVLIIALFACVLVLRPASDYAAETWADAALPIQHGLELWLDASRATGDLPLPANGKLNQWKDASGKNRTLAQPDANAQPSLLKIGGAAIVRFDGIDDQLRAVELNSKLDSFTIVIVAAARQNSGGFSALMAANAANKS